MSSSLTKETTLLAPVGQILHSAAQAIPELLQTCDSGPSARQGGHPARQRVVLLANGVAGKFEVTCLARTVLAEQQKLLYLQTSYYEAHTVSVAGVPWLY